MVELVTERLLLRPCTTQDADLVFAAEQESLADLRRWFWWCHPSHERRRCLEWAASRAAAWTNGVEYAFLALDKTQGGLVGCTWLNAIDLQSRRGSLGYWVRTSRAKQGYALEAVRAVTAFGFSKLRLGRVEIVIATGNEPSRRLAERLGGKLEGVARRRLVVNEQPQDAFIYSVLPEDL